ncbi:MAG TPA: dienelactone hydrolase family protein [Burkholderiales bacterium]
MHSYTRTIPVDGAGMALHGGTPATAERVPALVVVMHAPGVDTFIHSIVERLGRAGYAAVAPDLYHRQTGHAPPLERMRRLKDREIIADVEAAIGYLREHPQVDPERIGILGFCMGGRIAYMMAAVSRALRATVVYYGGNIMVPWGEDVPAPYERTADIGCPLQFHFGEEDDNPSPADRIKLDAELTRRGKAHEFHTYANAGHAFMNFTNPERYREAAAEASWPRTLAFLERHLRG